MVFLIGISFQSRHFHLKNSSTYHVFTLNNRFAVVKQIQSYNAFIGWWIDKIRYIDKGLGLIYN